MRNLTEAKSGSEVILCALPASLLEAYRNEASEMTRNLLTSYQFAGTYGQTAALFDETGKVRQILVGTEKGPEDPRAPLQLFARLAEVLAPGAYTLDEASWKGWDREQIALGWGLATYNFDRYLRRDKPRQWPTLFVDGLDVRRVQRMLSAIFLVRDLINTPASDLGPAELCEEARKVAEQHGATFTTITGEALETGFPAIHAVGKGSDRAPALIDLRWGDASHPRLTLVGKGVVFDSGGYDLKSADGMLLMKKDMGGGAVSLALAQLIMASKLPVQLRLLIPAVENSVSGNAYRPGDILKTRKGLTVEIGNTDAEGRVVLCDALAEAVSESPDLIIDMATLTGACRIALGQDLPGFFTPSNELAARLEEAAQSSCDPLWRLPLWMPYLNMLKANKISDLNNSASSSFAGSITAALYLNEFVKPYTNWIHLDMYAWRSDAVPGTPKGGEATALRAVFQFLEARYTR